MNKTKEELQCKESLLNAPISAFDFNSPDIETIELLLVEKAFNLIIKDMSELNGLDGQLLKSYYLYKSGESFAEKADML